MLWINPTFQKTFVLSIQAATHTLETNSGKASSNSKSNSRCVVQNGSYLRFDDLPQLPINGQMVKYFICEWVYQLIFMLVISKDLIVDSFIVDEVIKKLEGWLGFVFGDHVTCSFYCDYVEFVLVELVEAGMLISHIPATPFSDGLSMNLCNILLSVSERHNIIEVSTKQPYSHLWVEEYSPVLCHWALLGNSIVESRTNWPSFVDFVYFIVSFIKIPVFDSSIIRWAVGYLSKRWAYRWNDVIFTFGAFIRESFFESQSNSGCFFTCLIDI